MTSPATLAIPPIKTLLSVLHHRASRSESQPREKQVRARPFVLFGSGVGAAKYTLLARALRGPDCTLALTRPSPYYTLSFTRSLAHTPDDLSRDRGYAVVPKDTQETGEGWIIGL